MKRGCLTPLELAMATWMSWSRMVSKGCTAIRRLAKTWAYQYTLINQTNVRENIKHNKWLLKRSVIRVGLLLLAMSIHSVVVTNLIEKVHDSGSSTQLFHLHPPVTACATQSQHRYMSDRFFVSEGSGAITCLCLPQSHSRWQRIVRAF